MTEHNKSAKASCLVIFKQDSTWNRHFVEKLGLEYEVHILFSWPIFQQSGSLSLCRAIQQKIGETNAQLVFVDADFQMIIDAALIRNSTRAAKIRVLVTWDDQLLHEHNSLNALACDLILSADPISVMRYKEKGKSAEYVALEGSPKLYFDRKLKRDIDVLHFGTTEKADRREFIESLERAGITVTKLGAENTFVSLDELGRRISRAKIVVNFAKTYDLLKLDSDMNLGLHQHHPYLLQFKGRVIEAGLSKTLCISEYTPAFDLLFTNDEIPTFTTPEQCVSLVRHFLRNEKDRVATASKLYKACKRFTDVEQIKIVTRAISKISIAVPTHPFIPKSYVRRVFKARLNHMLDKPTLAIKEVIFFNHQLHAAYPKSKGVSFGEMTCAIAKVLFFVFIFSAKNATEIVVRMLYTMKKLKV